MAKEGGDETNDAGTDDDEGSLMFGRHDGATPTDSTYSTKSRE